MASTKTRIKPIRIANETADYFEGKPLNRMVESLHHLIETGKVSFDGEEIKIPDGVYSVTTNSGNTESVYSGGVNTNILNTMTDLEEIAIMCGMTLEDLAGQFCEMLNDGTLTVEGGVLKVDV